MFFKKHKELPNGYFASPQGEPPEDPLKQPKVTANEYGTRKFHNMPKKPHPNPPRNQYGTNSVGSIDNSNLDALRKDDSITNTGLTEEEQDISDLIVQIWNKFTKLEQTHPSDLEEVQRAIHILQSVLAMRTVRRDYPNQWVSYKDGE